jgi:hypothetical protein
MLPRQLSGGGGPSPVMPIVLGLVGYGLTSSIWFAAILAIVSYIVSYLFQGGLYSPTRMILFVVISLLITAFVMSKLSQQVTIGGLLVVGGNSILSIWGWSLSGVSSSLATAAPAATTTTLSSASVSSTTTTTLQGAAVSTSVTDSKKVCGVDCTLFNGDFQYYCNGNTSMCDKAPCTQTGQCSSGYTCKSGICSR